MNYPDILEIITDFYRVATADMMIGFHFRHIADFHTHLPRISHFWHLQLMGTCLDPTQLPFHLFPIHAPLGLKSAQIRRFVVLFRENLQKHKALPRWQHPEDQALFILWEKKILHFQDKFLHHFCFLSK